MYAALQLPGEYSLHENCRQSTRQTPEARPCVIFQYEVMELALVSLAEYEDVAGATLIQVKAGYKVPLER